MLKNKKTTVALLGVLLVAVVITVGVTYALWQITLQQETTNTITTGCFKVTMEEGEAINLTNAYPMSDEEGKNLVPYTFTIKNNCTEKASYVLNLETVSEGEKILKDEYVKASLKNNENELFLNTLNDTNENLEKVIESASKAYKLTEGTLSGEEEKTFELRLWMDENTEAIEEVMNANFMGKITLTSSYVPYKPSNRMIAMSYEDIYVEGSRGVAVNSVYTQNNKYIIKEVIYESRLQPYQDAVEVVDFSVDQDKTVLGYYVKNAEEENYTLYIQANGKIKVNPQASYYGMVCYTNISPEECRNGSIVKGMENWDTSEVINMGDMFYGNNFLDADFSTWDTSKVTNMSGMFNWQFSYGDVLNTHFDLSNFDTRNVTNMRWMFYGASNLTTTINITNPNVTSYDNMFYGAATGEGAQITVNYTAETSDLVDRMIATKSEGSNVVKGSLIS